MSDLRYLVTRRLLWLLLGSIIWSPGAMAATTGKISGTVVDETGVPIPGVQVVVEDTYPLKGAVTGADGFYQILNVEPGVYTVAFRYIGFADVRIEGVEVVVDATVHLDAQLREAVVEGEEVVVTAERPLIQPDRTTTTSVVSEKQLEALPVSSLGEAIELQAGVVDGHFRGGRHGEVAYLVNGVPINNAFSNSAAFEIQENAVSNLEVISGVFNAEHGQALSGIVNIVTKSTPRDWSATFQADVGGFASTRKLPFLERTVSGQDRYSVSDFETVSVPYYEAAGIPNWQNYEFSVGGPVLQDKLGFRVTGRYRRSESHIIGRNLFLPSDSSDINISVPREDWIVESSGDGSYVAAHSRRLFLNPNIVYSISPRLQLDYNAFVTDATGRGLDHFYKYVPEGQNRWYQFNQTHILALRASLSPTSFATLSYSYLHDKSDTYLYRAPATAKTTGELDERYVPPQHSDVVGSHAFAVGGNHLSTWDGSTRTHSIVASYTNQISRVHQIKTGAQIRLHSLQNRNYGIEVSPRTNWRPMVSLSRFSDDRLDVSPAEYAAYVQDKMEFKNLIVNAGIRFDAFDADYFVPLDWSQAAQERIPNLPGSRFYDPEAGDSVSNRVDTEPRFQFSPRLGIAFPISSQGVIRFSAGLFFQIPRLSVIYTNPEYEVNPAAGSNVYGNPGINPERTLAFEVGVQQGLADDIGVEVTVFAKDVRNLTGQEFTYDIRYLTPAIHWVNLDYGTIRGITFSLFKRPSGSVFWNVDYTLQFAEGSASDPGQAFGRWQSGLEPIRRLNRLDWDRRHVLNNQITYAPSSRFSLSFIGRLQTGSPYTSQRDFVRSYVENNVDKTTHFVADIRFYWAPVFLPENLQLFLQMDNIFDEQVINWVHSDTGSPTQPYQKIIFERSGAEVGGLNTLDEWFFNQSAFGPPRRVKLGFRVRY